MYFNYFCQLLWTSNPKYKIRNSFNESDLNTKWIQKSLLVNQSINQSINHQPTNQPINQSTNQYKFKQIYWH